MLAKDNNWLAFLDFCQRNGLYDGLPAGVKLIEQAASEVRMSRLEKRLLHQQDAANSRPLVIQTRKLGLAGNEQYAMWQSGLKAEQAVEAADAETNGE